MTRVLRPRPLFKTLALGLDKTFGQESGGHPDNEFKSVACPPEGIRIESWRATCPMEECSARLPRVCLGVVPTNITQMYKRIKFEIVHDFLLVNVIIYIKFYSYYYVFITEWVNVSEKLLD